MKDIATINVGVATPQTRGREFSKAQREGVGIVPISVIVAVSTIEGGLFGYDSGTLISCFLV